MLTITLLRHAKSGWGDARLADHDRPLNERGLADAPRIGDWLAGAGLVPDFVVCSTAKRTRATLALVVGRLQQEPEIAFRKGLYLASAAALLKVVRATSAGVRHVMLVGHNPGLHELAGSLAGAGSRDDRAAMAAKFPTAAAAVIAFDVGDWKGIAPGGGRLVWFMSPKRLGGQSRGR